MTEITAYKACDGKTFDDEQECFEYESTLESKRTIVYLFKNCVDFLGKDYEVLPIDTEGYFLDNTFYIRFKKVSNEERQKIFGLLGSQFGILYEVQKNKSDNLYYFDGEEHRFQSLSYKIELLKDEISVYENIKNNLITQLELMEEN